MAEPMRRPKLALRNQEEDDDITATMQSLLSGLCFWIVLVLAIVVCSVLNCWIEQRREERRITKQRSSN